MPATRHTLLDAERTGINACGSPPPSACSWEWSFTALAGALLWFTMGGPVPWEGIEDTAEWSGAAGSRWRVTAA